MNKEQKKLVLQIFAFLAVINLVVVVFIVNNARNEKEQASWLNDLQAKDVLLMLDEADPPRYYFIRLNSISDEVIYFQSPMFYHKAPTEMKLNDGFISKAFTVSRERFDVLQAEGKVLKVFRGYPNNSPYTKFFTPEELGVAPE